MERIGLHKRNFLSLFIDAIFRNVKYRKVNLIKEKSSVNIANNKEDKNCKIIKEMQKGREWQRDENIQNEVKVQKEKREQREQNEREWQIEKDMQNEREWQIEKDMQNESEMQRKKGMQNEREKQRGKKEPNRRKGKREKQKEELNEKKESKEKKELRGLREQKSKKIKKRNKLLIFIFMVALPIIVFEIFTKLIEPSLIAMCEIRANSIGVSVSNKAIKQVMEEVGYETNLVTLEKDNEGNIIALKANVVEMNYIASLIGSRTQQMYNELTETYVQIPVGNFTGNAILAGRGPRIKVKIMPVGTVASDFKTEFVSTGINQTRHRVYLQVVSNMRVIAPFSTKTITVVNNVNVAETVLIGDVPSSYYNLEGVNDAVDDSLNLWDE